MILVARCETGRRQAIYRESSISISTGNSPMFVNAGSLKRQLTVGKIMDEVTYDALINGHRVAQIIYEIIKNDAPQCLK
ncbi:hypothetical protein [uncultured Corynebacterium sp.]|uniref:hypothetical protein n=1 Tax=uncultured Corynebacterium sp. TaxID=159447 RepID=UPI0028E7F00C|nr:hypothetical protein [uncultured Corynebacterium sp.]